MSAAVNCSAIRSDFPTLEDKDVVFLDNAASTLKPRQVIDSMTYFTINRYSNVHRGIYRLSMEASKAYEDAHEIVAKFIGAAWSELVFTKNTTDSIQLAALTLLWNKVIDRGTEIIVTEAEHHSNLLPWIRVAKLAGARLRFVPVDREGIPRWEVLGSIISDKTKVIAVGHVSNVTGYISPIRDIARIAHEHGAIIVVDSAQGVPHIPVNVKELGVDMLAFSGHKMLGPSGIGGLYIRQDLAESLEPPLGAGGTVSRVKMVDGAISIEWLSTPWKFESGTPPIIEAVGLSEAVNFLNRIGMDNIMTHEIELTRYMLDRLREIRDVTVLGPSRSPPRQGIVAFTVNGADPDWIGLILDRHNIAVRTGLHCAHILHDRLNASKGSIRASVYLYNCKDDIDKMIEALTYAISKVKNTRNPENKA